MQRTLKKKKLILENFTFVDSTHIIRKNQLWEEAIMDGICYETPSTNMDEKQNYEHSYKSFTEEAIMDGLYYEKPSTKKDEKQVYGPPYKSFTEEVSELL